MGPPHRQSAAGGLAVAGMRVSVRSRRRRVRPTLDVLRPRHRAPSGLGELGKVVFPRGPAVPGWAMRHRRGREAAGDHSRSHASCGALLARPGRQLRWKPDAGRAARGVERRPRRRRLGGAPLRRYATPSTFAAFFTSRGFTHRIAPYRPIPAHTASVAVTLIFAAASFSYSPATAPGRSSPLMRNTFLGPVSLILAAFAAATNAAAFSGTKSIWVRRASGNPEYARRFTPASRSTFNTRTPSPGLSGTIV